VHKTVRLINSIAMAASGRSPEPDEVFPALVLPLVAACVPLRVADGLLAGEVVAVVVDDSLEAGVFVGAVGDDKSVGDPDARESGETPNGVTDRDIFGGDVVLVPFVDVVFVCP
jgi:hypothetical protein